MKRFLFLSAILLAATKAFAGQVDLTQAQGKAEQFLQSRNAMRMNRPSVGSLRLLHAEASADRLAQPAYYIFNSDNAFVIVAGDDRAPVILGYGDGALDMKTIPENMKFWLDYYKKQMEYLQDHPGMMICKPVIKTGQSVEPMLEAMWNQDSPYNNLCPQDVNGRALTGCATTSLAQVFFKWKHPTTPTPAVRGYTTRNGKFTLPELPSITFDWEHMLPIYWYGQYDATNANAVAQLMRYIGQAEEMNYDRAGSDAWEDDIVRACETFGYEEAYAVYKSTINFDTGVETTYINDEDWAALMLEELLAGRPMVFCAFDRSNSYNTYFGHAFNVDGYDATDGTFHINWGWSGTGNGNFVMNSFANQGPNYHMGQRIVKNIQPAVSVVPTIKVKTERIDLQTRLGEEPVTATFTVKGKLLTDDVTMSLNDPDGVFELDETVVTLDEIWYGKVITVTYTPVEVGESHATVTLTSPGAQDKVIALNGTAAHAAVDPVMQPAATSAISLTSFRADWTDATAADYVSSYTLEVMTRPSYALVGEADWSSVVEKMTAESANAANYFPSGWTFMGNDLWAENGYISINGDGRFSTPTYDFDDYGKVTVVLSARAVSSSSAFTVSTSVDSKDFAVSSRTFNEYVVVLDCAAADQVTVSNKSNNPGFLNMKIYAGELPSSQLRASETGNEAYRLITDITNKFYTVNGLTEGGTFLYKVKAIYTDGTESPWSNVEKVTLFENGHNYDVGDVNHDGFINVTDITVLISAVLANGEGICPICADLTGDSLINVTDITTIINVVLNSAK